MPHRILRGSHVPSILIIDAYDSFTNNLISLLTTSLACDVRVLHIDTPALDLRAELQHYDAVICGPGPGHPANQDDVGLMRQLWALDVPVLGICLGFQSLCLEFGAEVRALQQGIHGLVKRVRYYREEMDGKGQGLFAGVQGEISSVLYQSLCADIGQCAIPTEEWPERKWQPTERCPDLLPLAWVEQLGVDERVLVGVKHRTKPFWALQYHPESICTDEHSVVVMQNWLAAALKWNNSSGRLVVTDGVPKAMPPTSESLLSIVARNQGQTPKSSSMRYARRVLLLQNHMSVSEIAELLQGAQRDQIILESSNSHLHTASATNVRGRYSIIALDVDAAPRLSLSLQSGRAGRLTSSIGTSQDVDFAKYGDHWGYMASYLESRRVTDGDFSSPFWGGWMGYCSYELGLLQVNIHANGILGFDDLNFAWVTRSIVVDHEEAKIYVQELGEADVESLWLDATAVRLQDAMAGIDRKNEGPVVLPNIITTAIAQNTLVATLPTSTLYESRVSACQAAIRAGNAYELCLTGTTLVSFPTIPAISPPQLASTTAWQLYQSLRTRSPAPFASFLHLGATTLISASPESFLALTSTGRCSLRPMKGTVRKSAACATLAAAERLLAVPKERAENLMIVDLVRHDLHGVCGPGRVTVPRLMVVEEHASVWQMVSVVEGQLPPVAAGEPAFATRHTGVDVLRASLPPGSMTGAPKRRACEILRGVEDGERGGYSGVTGYLDVGGRGEFSVNIRCAWRVDGDGGEGKETWRIGAGGAVTALSTPVGEREEMETKLRGTLAAFGVGV